MTTQRTFEPHEFEPHGNAENVCRHCDRGRYALHHLRYERSSTKQTSEQCADDCHFGDHDESPASRAGERDEWRVHVNKREVVNDGGFYVAFVTDELTATEIVTEHNQHATLIEQRERLLRLLRPVTSPTACYCAVMKGEKCWDCEARELIAAIEQETEVESNTSGEAGR